ncbi:MAG: ferritin family protein [Deltaproteobacteria bacterium]|nr:ferritin family protein [Deltaproteobacteria bacterium]
MDTTQEGMLAGIDQAIQAETDGYHFYQIAARNTRDEGGRVVFETLAEDELEHVRYLRACRGLLLKESPPEETVPALGEPRLGPDDPIFSPAIRSRLHEAHIEISALSLAMHLEANAVRFYDALATAATDAWVREMYRRLALWEEQHLRMLKREHDLLIRDYDDAAARFAQRAAC